AELLPSYWGRVPRTLPHALGWSVVAGVAALAALWLSVIAIMAARLRELPATPGGQALLAPARVPARRARRPGGTVAALAAGAGATALTFNLGVLLAVSGVLRDDRDGDRSVRPICVLTEGPLTSALGLSPGPLEDLVQNPFRLMPKLMELAVRHPSGCE